jgi:hypothetical protein
MLDRGSYSDYLLNTGRIEMPRRCFNGSLVPAPVADGCRVASWLNHIWVGVIVSMICTVICAVFMMPALDVPFLANVKAAFSHIAVATATWLMLTPEPDNSKWLQTARWLTRILTLLAMACAILLLAWPIITEQHEGVARILREAQGGLGLAAGALWSRYMRDVSWRIGDKVLRQWFGFLQWFCFTMLLITGFLLAVEAWRPELLAPSTSPEVATNAVAMPTETGRSWISWRCLVWTGSSMLTVWFMLRLARRIRYCCKYYLKASQ